MILNENLNIKQILKLSIFIFTILFSFSFYSYSNAAWLGPAQCSDGKTGCGYIADLPLLDECRMSGPDIYGGARILGGQICSTIGGSDFGGYYMNGTGEPNSNTPIFPFHSYPWGWTYSKDQGIYNHFGGSSIPTQIFQQPGLPYYNMKFFSDPGVSVNITFNQPDDSGRIQIGNNYYEWFGCDEDPRDVSKSNCPSTLTRGSQTFTAMPGDSISFQVKNHLRPNNGYGTWGAGRVIVTFGNLTVCHTKEYFDYYCNLNPVQYASFCGRQGYIPTSYGVCSPQTPAQPQPRLDVNWEDNNAKTITLNLTQGQTKKVNFIVKNIGDSGSKLKVDKCEPISGNNFLSIPDSSCPKDQIIPAYNSIDLKLALNNIINFFQKSFLIK